MKMRFYIWSFVLASMISYIASNSAKGDVEYDVTFDATWSVSTHPYDFPSNPHFSGLVGGTHNENITFWEEGGIASDGIESMAEIGSKTILISEVNAQILTGDAGAVLSGGGISPSPGSVTMSFSMNPAYPYVTLVTMIAPSPDWFVGVSGLKLMDKGVWLDYVVVDVFAYDAGTDSGVTYTSPNADITPHIPIEHINVYPLENHLPLGTFSFKLKCTMVGDINNDCRVDLTDLALLVQSWLVDCNLNPDNQACW